MIYVFCAAAFMADVTHTDILALAGSISLWSARRCFTAIRWARVAIVITAYLIHHAGQIRARLAVQRRVRNHL